VIVRLEETLTEIRKLHDSTLIMRPQNEEDDDNDEVHNVESFEESRD